ncbi:MAG TPA: ABC transporter permease [bacterium]|jgi:ABC-2 type transport system permease protein
MRAFFSTIVMGFRMYLRDRSSLFWGMAFPLILMGLIGLAFGRSDTLTFRVAYVDQGSGPLGLGLRAGLAQVSVFIVSDEPDEQHAIELLRKGQRTLVIIVPPFGSGKPVQVYFDQARVQDSRTALVILERFVAEANLQIAGVRQRAVTIKATGIAGAREIRFFDFLLPGILAMTVMQTGLQGVTWVITGYRQRLILKRVLATPVHPFVFLSGLVARYAVTNAFQLAIVVIVGVWVFHARIIGSLAMLGAVALFGALAFIGIGFMVSTLSKTPESANLLGSVLSFPMLFLAGTLWPRDFMPAFMQPVIALLPLTPLVEAMRGIATRGDAVTPYLAGLAYLGAWGAVTFALAVWRFKWE